MDGMSIIALYTGAWTGKVSLPAEYAGIDEEELKSIALECLIDNASRRDYLQFYKAKIIKK